MSRSGGHLREGAAGPYNGGESKTYRRLLGRSAVLAARGPRWVRGAAAFGGQAAFVDSFMEGEVSRKII